MFRSPSPQRTLVLVCPVADPVSWSMNLVGVDIERACTLPRQVYGDQRGEKVKIYGEN